MCVPKGSEHKAEAEAFINFMARADISASNAEYIGYSTPSSAALELLGEEITENPIIYPPQEAYRNFETYVNLPMDTRTLYDKLWTEILS